MAIKIIILSGTYESIMFESGPVGGVQDAMVPTSEQKVESRKSPPRRLAGSLGKALSHSETCDLIKAEQTIPTKNSIHEGGAHEGMRPMFRNQESHFQKISEHLDPMTLRESESSCWHLPQARKPVSTTSGMKRGPRDGDPLATSP